MFFLLDLLYLDGQDLAMRPLIERKERLAGLLVNGIAVALQRSPIGRGPAFYEKACALAVEGIVSKRADAPYAPGNCGPWLKVKCLNREQFVVIGWTDPEDARPFRGALLLGYYDPDGRLTYGGRVGTGIDIWRAATLMLKRYGERERSRKAHRAPTSSHRLVMTTVWRSGAGSRTPLVNWSRRHRPVQ